MRGIKHLCICKDDETRRETERYYEEYLLCGNRFKRARPYARQFLFVLKEWVPQLETKFYLIRIPKEMSTPEYVAYLKTKLTKKGTIECY